ncbi:MAG TPA: cytidylate kinase family protein [Candidatus Sulfotelmatobacter sp.]|nr:cytidylate kinase family protein [Candidatus Sulfotelmatobacter sp.]
MSIVAISRGTFSGGETLAKRVADRLGYQCVSREANLEEAAKQYDVPVEELGIAMEKPPSFWERMLGYRAAYLTYVRAALCEQARAGKLVYHGHLGQFLLPGVSHVIAVRVIADLEFRVRAAMRQQGLTVEGARAYIAKVDKERREWTRFLFGVDWDAAHHYDLVVNLGRMSMETACETVARLTERPEFQPTVASRKAVDDLALQARVSAALAKDFRTAEAGFEVAADDGVVIITGTTRWSEINHWAPEVARRVSGVKEVRSEIVFVPNFPAG